MLFVTDVSCRLGMLTLLDTWPRPISDLHLYDVCTSPFHNVVTFCVLNIE